MRSWSPKLRPRCRSNSPDLAVVQAVKRLPAMQRAAIALFYLEDRPVAEIADLLGIFGLNVHRSPDAWPATPRRSAGDRRSTTMSAEDQVRDQVVGSVRHIDPDIGTALDRVSRRGRRRHRLAVTLRVSVAAGLIVVIAIAAPGVLDLIRTPPRRPAQRSPVVPYSAIAGTYRATIPPGSGVVTQASMAGRWTLRLSPDGSLSLRAPAGFRAETSGITFRLIGREFQTNAFPNDLCLRQLPGRYHWSRIGGQLRFVLVIGSL